MKEPEILTEVEISRLFAVNDRHTPLDFRDYTIFMTLLDTGLRISELCALSVGDVNLENGYIRVMGKMLKERYVPVGYKLTRTLPRSGIRKEKVPHVVQLLFLSN